jgi:hypothetical protein
MSPTQRSLLYEHLPAAANSAEGVTPPRRSTPFNGLRSYKPVRFMGVDQQHIMPAFEVVAFLQVGSLWRTSRR